jgi:uncharacterized protein YprB with RNaseH-like and TPR domain
MKQGHQRFRRALRKVSGKNPARKMQPTIPEDVEEDLVDEVTVEVLNQTPEDVMFLDLETTGLRADRSLAAMIGFLYRRGPVLHLSQWYSGDAASERQQLQRLRDRMKGFREIVTYNGDGFDLPFLCQRWRWHGLEADCPLVSLDLLPLIRKRYRREWPNCRLVTAEERLLDLPRCEADVPGSEAPLRFQDLREGAPFQVIEPIYLHNRRDLISLVRLRDKLQEGIPCQ